MKDLILKIKLFYSQLIKGREKYNRHKIHPPRDWSILLSTFFILFCALTFLAYYFYVNIKNDTLFSTTEENVLNEKKININLLKQTVADIETRREMTNKIGGSQTIPEDPSL
jgi:hypothetical protein